jgi:hypothetical protein
MSLGDSTALHFFGSMAQADIYVSQPIVYILPCTREFYSCAVQVFSKNNILLVIVILPIYQNRNF